MEVCDGGGRGDKESRGQGGGLLLVAGWQALWGGMRGVSLMVGMRMRSHAYAETYWSGGMVTCGGFLPSVEVCVVSV